eukprot:EG_transcript_8745
MTVKPCWCCREIKDLAQHFRSDLRVCDRCAEDTCPRPSLPKSELDGLAESCKLGSDWSITNGESAFEPTYHSYHRVTVHEELRLTVWYDVDRRQLEAAQVDVFRQRREYTAALERLEDQLEDLKKVIWRLEALYQAVQCKFPDLTPKCTPSISAFYADVVARIPAVLEVLCDAPPSHTAPFKPRLLEQFVQLVDEAPADAQREGCALAACPADRPAGLKYLRLSHRKLHLYPSREAYCSRGEREACLLLEGAIVDCREDFMLVVRGPRLEPPMATLRLRFESGEEWRGWAQALRQAAGMGEEQVWQNERWLPVAGWRPSPLPGDPPAFSDRQGGPNRPLDAVAAEVEEMGYIWCGEWTLAAGEAYGPDGWQYAPGFGGPFGPPGSGLALVRRRLWTRTCMLRGGPL